MSSSEKKLLSAFLVLLLVGGFAVGLKYYLGHRKALDLEHAQAVEELEEIEEITRNRKLWETRNLWMNTGLPPALSDEKMRLAMSNLTSSRKTDKVAIKNLEFPAPDANSHFNIAKVKFQATGKLDEVMVWLQSLIVKEKFLTINYLQVRPGKSENQEADFLIILHKYYGK